MTANRKEAYDNYLSRVARLNVGYVLVSFGVGWLLREYEPDSKLALAISLMLLLTSYVALLRVISLKHVTKYKDD